jgi:hypothetical protein
MFAQHQPQIGAVGRASATGFAQVAFFSGLCARVPLSDAAADFKRAWAGEMCGSMFGPKWQMLDYLRSPAAGGVWEECSTLYEQARSEPAECEDAMLAAITRVPGLGLAKGGFALQLIWGLSGCLDTHNIARFGLRERALSHRPSYPSALLSRYNATCAAAGGPERLWDGWCHYVATKDAGRYDSAEHVSSLHLACIGGQL